MAKLESSRGNVSGALHSSGSLSQNFAVDMVRSKGARRNMRKGLPSVKKLAINLSLLTAFLLAFGCSTVSWAGTAEEGQKIFSDKCVRCHAEDGSGNTVIGKALGAADLRSADVQKKTDADFYTQIDKGKGNMPPFGTGLDKTQINELIAYIREIGKKQIAGKKH